LAEQEWLKMKRINVVLLLAAAILLSQTACSTGNQTNSTANTATQNSTSNTTAPTTTPAAPSNQNAGTQANASVSTANDPFSELVMLYSQLFTARMKGDRAKVESLLASDYKETTGDGKVLNKSQVLDTISPEKKYDSYTLDELKSTSAGDNGSVTGRVTVITQGKTESWRFNETFARKEGRWQAVSLKITDYKKQ
jgi:ABC-type transport system substrate-binding protein